MNDESIKDSRPKFLTEDVGNGVKIEMIWIPAGTFQMGSPMSDPDWSYTEDPVHSVSLDGCYIGKTPVTQAQYDALMGTNPSLFKELQKPVDNVSWDNAMAFCRKLSEKTGKTYTLPTEAQWEYACRAGSTTRFSFGGSDSDLENYAWYNENSSGETHPVGQKKANAFGLYDTHGNVFEWCADWFEENYYANSPTKNPKGPSSGEFRVLRGGFWYMNAYMCRSAYRGNGNPGDGRRNGSRGFRLAC